MDEKLEEGIQSGRIEADRRDGNNTKMGEKE